MPFGSLIAKSKEPIELETADSKRVIVNSFVKRMGLRLLGIPHVELRNRARLILGNYKVKWNDKILDAGSGIGLYALHYATNTENQYVMGVDISEDKIRNANKLRDAIGAKNCAFIVGDIAHSYSKNDNYDLIVCSDVLEHIPDDQVAFKELVRVLKPGGTMLLTFPSDNQHSRDTQAKFEHARPGYNKTMIKEMASKNNLIIEKIKGYSYAFGRFAWWINEKSFYAPPLAALLFYPLYWLTYLDILNYSGNPNGWFVKLKK
jgi:ubiquinone/menaquinone biosynthesis C-methylase UbiE